jgi:hypothetical protein
MFKVNEIKSWAKKHNIVIKRQGDEYVWHEESNKENINKSDSIDEAAKSIFNHITKNKYVEYQKEFQQQSKLVFIGEI